MYDRRCVYLTWGGAIGLPGVDVWQCGVKIANPSDPQALFSLPSESALQSLLEGAISTFHASSGAAINAGAGLLWAKAAILNEDGKYYTDPVVASRSRLNGAQGANASSPQQSMVVSMRSGKTLGKANHGRFYVPWFAGVTEQTGFISPTAQAAFRGAAQVLLNNINDWAAIDVGAETRIVIMSSVGAGATKAVTEVAVGNVVDSQRRRRNAFTETYSAAPVTTP